MSTSNQAKTALAEISTLDSKGQQRVLAALEAEGILEDSLYNWRQTARSSQLLPDWNSVWQWLVLNAGRGFGKTWAGSNITAEVVQDHGVRRVALIGPTLSHVRNVMIEGPSGILAQTAPSRRPLWKPGKRQLIWPNGAVGFAYSSERPSQLRGPEHDWAWADEIAHWTRPYQAYSNIRLGLRLGRHPRAVFTSTPRPLKIIRELVSDPLSVVRYGSTHENFDYLADEYKRIIKKYEGTRLGEQEIEGKVLMDNPGALWSAKTVDAMQVDPATTQLPSFAEIVVAIDPAVTHGPGASETGIVVAARGDDGLVYVLDDRSLRADPPGWGRAAASVFDERSADVYVGEVNNGGELVAANIRAVDSDAPIRSVFASRGKATRAQPIATLCEGGSVKFVISRRNGVRVLADLEDQMLMWQPTASKDEEDAMTLGGESRAPSPDRVDALVWAVTYLLRRELGKSKKFQVV